MQTKPNKNSAALSSKKAYGTVAKIIEMIEQDVYCPKIIQQIDAAIGLLNSSKKSLLRGHLNHCLIHNMEENKDNAVEELIKIFDLK